MNEEKGVSVLFVTKDSVYKSLVHDCYDINRDALSFCGTNPVIAHPPCRAWGQLSHMAKPRQGERELAIWAVDIIRKNGGVLEHPRASKLWKELNLPVGKDSDEYGGFSICVNQSWFGHKAQKKTLLYIVGVKRKDIPPYPITFDAVQYTISTSKAKNRVKKEAPKKDREATPLQFAKWLIELAKSCKTN